MAIKVTPALPIGLVLVERLAAGGNSAVAHRRQAVGCTVGVALGLALWLLFVPACSIGWQRNIDCLARWCRLVPTKAIDTGRDLTTGDSYSVRNQSLVNSVRHLGNWIAEEVCGGPDSLQSAGPGDPPRAMDRPLVDYLLLATRLAIVALAALAAVWIGRRDDPLASAGLFALGLAATLVVSPVARTHYFLLLAPAVLLVPWHLYRHQRPRLAWWLAWTPTVLVVPHYFCPLAAGRIGWLGIGITAWLVAGGIVLCRVGGLPVRSSAFPQASRLGSTELTEVKPQAFPLTGRFASCREPAVSSVVGGFDPSES
jgi:hypothetical protein